MRAALLLLLACGSESAPAPAPSASAAGSQVLATMIPKVEAAKVLGSKAPNDAYAMEIWCIDEAEASTRIVAALAREGWSAVRTTGVSPQLAIAAVKGDIRFSARTSSNPRCAGTYLTATVMRLGAAPR